MRLRCKHWEYKHKIDFGFTLVHIFVKLLSTYFHSISGVSIFASIWCSSSLQQNTFKIYIFFLTSNIFWTLKICSVLDFRSQTFSSPSPMCVCVGGGVSECNPPSVFSRNSHWVFAFDLATWGDNDVRGKNHFRREKNWLKLQSHKIINVESKSILRGFEDLRIVAR